MIIEPELKAKLEQIPHSPQGFALMQYLELAQKELGDIKTAESWEEVQGRKFALKVISDLFIFMGEKKVVITSKNQYI